MRTRMSRVNAWEEEKGSSPWRMIAGPFFEARRDAILVHDPETGDIQGRCGELNRSPYCRRR